MSALVDEAVGSECRSVLRRSVCDVLRAIVLPCRLIAMAQAVCVRQGLGTEGNEPPLLAVVRDLRGEAPTVREERLEALA